MKLRKYSKFDSILNTGLWQTKAVLYKFYLNFRMFLLVVVIVVNMFPVVAVIGYLQGLRLSTIS